MKKSPLVVALDLNNPEVALELIQKLSSYVLGFKVGPRLTFRNSTAVFKSIKNAGALLFFDHKFFDIPTTTCEAVRAAAELGADWVTVHALNGEKCLTELALLESEIRKINSQFRVLVVTVLTSFNESSLPPVWKNLTIEESVGKLAESALRSGLRSFVCSPHEIAVIKKMNPDAFIVTPGVRFEGSRKVDDQSRVATPQQAIKSGAAALVVGRPIIEATDPVAACKEILNSL